ncbi:Protein of unknown function [Propionibacterium freudenreichii]|nr:Protein of unknown function [Propionibacterium freudenreichii]CEH05698.1 Protein of unknown function [Propionibacterium freudenreichii]CEI33449.1 Protein of unknown function [Propionibacterium freudenreichii]
MALPLSLARTDVAAASA